MARQQMLERLASGLFVFGVVIGIAPLVRPIQPFATKTVPIRAILKTNSASVYRIAFSPDSRLFAAGSGSLSGGIYLWDSASLELLRTFGEHDDSIWSLCFSPDGTTIASGSGMSDGTVKLWETSTGKLLHTLPPSSAYAAVESLDFSPNGLLAAGDGNGGLRLWESATGQLRYDLKRHSKRISKLKFSPDGETLASASWDRTIGLWDVNKGTLRAVLRGHSDLVLRQA